MKVSTICSAYMKSCSAWMLNAKLSQCTVNLPSPEMFYTSFDKRARQIETFEKALLKRLPELEAELEQERRWRRNGELARGGYNFIQLNVKERKAYLTTRRENRRHLHRIKVLEARLKFVTDQDTALLESYHQLVLDTQKQLERMKKKFDDSHTQMVQENLQLTKLLTDQVMLQPPAPIVLQVTQEQWKQGLSKIKQNIQEGKLTLPPMSQDELNKALGGEDG